MVKQKKTMLTLSLLPAAAAAAAVAAVLLLFRTFFDDFCSFSERQLAMVQVSFVQGVGNS